MRSCRMQQRGFIRATAEHRCCTGERWKMTVMLGYKLTPESFWMQASACECACVLIWSDFILWTRPDPLVLTARAGSFSPAQMFELYMVILCLFLWHTEYSSTMWIRWYDWSTRWLFGKGGQVWILRWNGSGNGNQDAVNNNSPPMQLYMGVNHVKPQFYERSAWVGVQRIWHIPYGDRKIGWDILKCFSFFSL